LNTLTKSYFAYLVARQEVGAEGNAKPQEEEVQRQANKNQEEAIYGAPSFTRCVIGWKQAKQAPRRDRLSNIKHKAAP